MYEKELRDLANELLPKASALATYMYENPELSCKEKLASEAMVKILRANGFDVTYPFMEKELGYGTAFKAVLKRGEGPTAAIMVEYDALPEIGHACGHNLHGSLSILSGLMLSKLPEGAFHGTLEVIGTPGEEDDGAKLHMAPAGVFDDCSLAIMMHSGSQVSRSDSTATALRCYVVEFFGESSHAAGAPWNGRNAVTCARKFLDLVDARRDTFHPGTIFSSVILDGGRQPNVIPEYAKVRLEFRYATKAELERLDRIVRNCAKGAAIALDCKEKFTLGFPDFYDMVQVPALEDRITELFTDWGEPVEPPLPPKGSTDVGNVSYRCPAIQPKICITKKPYSTHTPEFREATRTPEAQKKMALGAIVIAQIVLDIFNDKEFRDQVREDFERALKEKEL